MRLSIIIVNHNACHYLDQCLVSLDSALQYVDADVWIVDNASTDGSRKWPWMRNRYIHYIYNKENVGFARACNQVLRWCEGRYVMFLNPDTLLPERMVRDVLNLLDRTPDAGAVGVRMLDASGVFLPESKRGDPTLLSCFCKVTGLGRLFPRSRCNDYYAWRVAEGERGVVDVLAGACLTIRADLLRELGGLDERFFLYAEDVDLSVRVRQAAYYNYYLPTPMLHYKGMSTDRWSYGHVRQFHRATWQYYRKTRGGWRALACPLVALGLGMLVVGGCLRVWFHRLVYGRKGREREPLFLSYLPKDSADRVFELLRKYHLQGNIIQMEPGADVPTGKERAMLVERDVFALYDIKHQPVSELLKCVERLKGRGARLATYNPERNVLVTPDKCYV